MLKISVIVPVYKVEQYLCRCIDSILNQTFKDFELILVDDGSPDSCPKICDEYAVKDSRVHVIHKKNGGVSDARNLGIENSTGEYITFVDADDEITPFALEKMINAINNSNIVFGGATWIGKEKNEIFSYEEKNIPLTAINFNELLSDSNSYSAWGKLYIKEKIIKNKIRFVEDIVRGEDSLFVFTYLLHCDRISFIQENVYNYYFINSNFLGKAYPFKDEKRIFQSIVDLIRKNNSDENINYLINASIFNLKNRIEIEVKNKSVDKNLIKEICSFYSNFIDLSNINIDKDKKTWFEKYYKLMLKQKYKKIILFTKIEILFSKIKNKLKDILLEK